MYERAAEELMRDVTRLRRTVRRRLTQTRPEPRMPPAQLELLQQVEDYPGTGVSAAAQALRLADNSVSGLVNQLVGAGMLRRDTDPRDRRAVRLHLTERATERLATWRTARAELVAATLCRLAAADREVILAAVPALRRLADELAAPAPAPQPAST